MPDQKINYPFILKAVQDAVASTLAGKPVDEVVRECYNTLEHTLDSWAEERCECHEQDLINAAESF